MSMLSDDTLLVEHKMMNSCRVWPADSEKWQSEYRAWVKSDDHSHAETQLKRWLDGLDLPAQSLDTQPYLTLLRALPRGDERTNSSLRMAKLASLLIFEFCASPTVTPSANGVLYNLLCFCAGLAQPDVLAGPLDDLMTYRDLRGCSWIGYDLSAAQRLALIWNQPDERWVKSVWKPMLLGDASCRVHGNPIDAVDGLLKIYPIGRALRGLEPGPNSNHEDQEEFSRFLDVLIEREGRTFDSLFEEMQIAGCSATALRLACLDIESEIVFAYDVTQAEASDWILHSCKAILLKGNGTRSKKFLRAACITRAAYWTRKPCPQCPSGVLPQAKLLGLPEHLART